MPHLSKEERLALIKQRHEASQIVIGEIPVTRQETAEAVSELDSFREYERDKKTSSEVLTSDEM